MRFLLRDNQSRIICFEAKDFKKWRRIRSALVTCAVAYTGISDPFNSTNIFVTSRLYAPDLYTFHRRALGVHAKTDDLTFGDDDHGGRSFLLPERHIFHVVDR